jgi:hypothetical protein
VKSRFDTFQNQFQELHAQFIKDTQKDLDGLRFRISAGVSGLKGIDQEVSELLKERQKQEAALQTLRQQEEALVADLERIKAINESKAA